MTPAQPAAARSNEPSASRSASTSSRRSRAPGSARRGARSLLLLQRPDGAAHGPARCEQLLDDPRGDEPRGACDEYRRANVGHGPAIQPTRFGSNPTRQLRRAKKWPRRHGDPKSPCLSGYVVNRATRSSLFQSLGRRVASDGLRDRRAVDERGRARARVAAVEPPPVSRAVQRGQAETQFVGDGVLAGARRLDEEREPDVAAWRNGERSLDGDARCSCRSRRSRGSSCRSPNRRR